MKTTPLSRTASLCAGALVALAGAAALPAHAGGLYVGGNIGSPHFNDPVNNIEGHGNGVAGKVYGGYEVTPNFALEAGLAELGHIDDAAGRARGHAPYLDAVGILPIGHDFSLLGRVGVTHVRLDTPNGDDSDTTLKAGLGAQYALTPHASLRAEWERYRPEVFGARTDIDQYTVGVKWSF